MNGIYLDNSATTALSDGAKQAMIHALAEISGNPSSVHAAGIEAKKAVEDARSAVVASLGLKERTSGTLFFTSGGTEADNLALVGAAEAKNFRFTPRIITTASEHPAILNTIAYLKTRGFDTVLIPTPGGVPDMDAFEKALTPETAIVSVMLVNNETGAVNDVAGMFKLVRQKCPSAVTHTDAVQGYTKVMCNPLRLGADLLSVSAHKIHGPKGVGALWCSQDIIRAKKLVPIQHGGGQEEGFRSGTENVPAIVGFGAAAAEAASGADKRTAHIESLRKRLVSGLPDGVSVNVPEKEYVPNIVSLTLPSVKSEVMVRFLSSNDIFVSAGSACSSHHRGISHVLTDFGLSEQKADCTIRVSMDAYNTEADIDAFCDALKRGIGSLCKVRR